MGNKRCILVLCTGNSARSQMAEGLINHFLGDQWEAYSAGTQPAESVHPLAIEVMAEIGIDISHQRPKHMREVWGIPFDIVITVCDNAQKSCPAWLGQGHQVHIGFPDPSAATGGLEEQRAIFRRLRDSIRDQVLGYLIREYPDSRPT